MVDVSGVVGVLSRAIKANPCTCRWGQGCDGRGHAFQLCSEYLVEGDGPHSRHGTRAPGVDRTAEVCQEVCNNIST